MERQGGQGEERVSSCDAFAEQREALARVYRGLPVYGSAAFWDLVEKNQIPEQVLPLEVLVMILREEAIAREDHLAQGRLCEVIFARVQQANEQWVQQVLFSIHPLASERHAFAADLYADLCEKLLRALLNVQLLFWQERFFHCLRFLRKQVFESFLRREGCWYHGTSERASHVPINLLESLERMARAEDSGPPREVSDERAERALLAVEQTDLATLLHRLPVELRTVVWLVYWEDYTVEAISKLLALSKRAVYYRLTVALNKLRRFLEDEQEMRDGASA